MVSGEPNSKSTESPLGRLAVPLSILAGAALIAAALYFGLRARDSAVAATEAANASVQAVPVTSTPATPPKAAIDRAIHEAAIARAVEEKHASWRKQCWEPSVAKTEQPAESAYVMELAIDETGHEVGRGISDLASARADVGQCLRSLRDPISIPAPGIPITTRVILKFS